MTVSSIYRVDDHPSPIDELHRILQLHKFYFFSSDPHDILIIDQALACELQELLTITGDYQGSISGIYDDATRDAFREFSGRENLEERWSEDARIDCIVLEFMRKKDQKIVGMAGYCVQYIYLPYILDR